MANSVLKVSNVTKRFGGLVAVNDVSLEVFPGEVVALVGDNGAGKSTLIKIISGVYSMDSGQLFFEGQRVNITLPAQARALGIETIYQDLALAENLDVGANLFLGREAVSQRGFLRTLKDDYMRAQAEDVLKRLDVNIPSMHAKIGTLSGGQRQAVAISRAVYWNAKLMIMDEPTAALGVPEQRKVIALIKQLRDQQIPVILISHTMQDILEADRIIVMRRGRKVAEVPQNEASAEMLVRHMVGGVEG